MTDTELLPLEVAAHAAFPQGGVTAKTLLLRARQGKLNVYRPGKSYLTTLAEVREMIRACRVNPRGRDCGSDQLGTMRPASSHESAWFILDGNRQLSTGLGASEIAEAEKALADYLAEKHTGQVTKGKRDPDAILIDDMLALYVRDKVADQAREPRAPALLHNDRDGS
jgi:hypothetical protein